MPMFFATTLGVEYSTRIKTTPSIFSLNSPAFGEFIFPLNKSSTTDGETYLLKSFRTRRRSKKSLIIFTMLFQAWMDDIDAIVRAARYQSIVSHRKTPPAPCACRVSQSRRLPTFRDQKTPRNPAAPVFPRR